MKVLLRAALAFLIVAVSFCEALGSEFSWCSTEVPIGTLINPQKQLIEVRVVFMGFADGDSLLPTWVGDLRGDVRSYCLKMSANPSQDVNLRVVKRSGADSVYAWVTAEPLSYFYQSGHYATPEILTKIANTFNPQSTWTDIDAILVVQYRRTPLFPDSTYIGISDLSYPASIAVPSLDRTLTRGTTQQMETKPYKIAQETVMVHEFMHLLGFAHPPNGRDCHYGRYNLMAGTSPGLSILDEGLIAIHPFELAKDNVWAPAPEIITVSRLDVPIPDFFKPTRADRKSFRVIMSTTPENDQSFFIVNHQGSGIDAIYQGRGLLIWHLLRPRDIIGPGGWDLEVASGKTPNAETGLDALEASTAQNLYFGSAGDFFDGIVKRDFTYNTNPNSNLYSSGDYSAGQTVQTDFAVENIRQQVSGDMLADIYLSRAQLIQAPNGTEIVRGSVFAVTWRTRSSISAASVDLEVSDDGGSTFRLIQAGLQNTGSYGWQVLQKAGSNYRLCLISRRSDGSELGRDYSDGAITIVDSRTCSP